MVTSDGTARHPGNAPYNRMIVTASARDISSAGVAQPALGRRIVMPWGTDL
ncbi:hypothetical protein [Actinomadura keratinilytica]|uniref:hypothetical protein n=1 Tax=Actinomadura keratinilytica TaxID=547461 RepID=UPI0036124082